MVAIVPGRLNTDRAKVAALAALSVVCAASFAQGLGRQFTTLDDFGPTPPMSPETARIAQARPAPDYAMLELPVAPLPEPVRNAAPEAPKAIELTAIEPAPELVTALATAPSPEMLTPESLAIDSSALTPEPAPEPSPTL